MILIYVRQIVLVSETYGKFGSIPYVPVLISGVNKFFAPLKILSRLRWAFLLAEKKNPNNRLDYWA